MKHTPVLLKETVGLLNPKPGEFFVDGTVGGGGHAAAVLEKMLPRGKFLAIDWDKDHLENSRAAIEGKLPIPSPQFPTFWIKGNYADLADILKERNLSRPDIALLDLGFSSEHLESGRGFSFHPPAGGEPLLMTYARDAEPLKQILKELTEEEIFQIIRELGEERYAKKIARAIYERERRNPIETTGELAETIKGAVPKNYERGRIHPATRTFQAFRIYANHELENLEKFLQNLTAVLKPNGRAAIISFHSLEDRLVKGYFNDYAKAGKAEILTKKPVVAAKAEIAANPRARAAKLRALQIK